MTHSLLKRIVDKEILIDSQEYKEIHRIKEANAQLVMDINIKHRDSLETNEWLSKITGEIIDDSVTISLPFYTDFGRHIQFGSNIFINKNVLFVDLGGIVIEDDVMIGPSTRLITVNHLTDPTLRKGIHVNPIRLKKNAWLGANVTILPGVTVGENSIVAADSTVTKDVPDNVIVAGSPAKLIKPINT